MFSNEIVSIAMGAFHFKLESFVRTRILQSGSGSFGSGSFEAVQNYCSQKMVGQELNFEVYQKQKVMKRFHPCFDFTDLIKNLFSVIS